MIMVIKRNRKGYKLYDISYYAKETARRNPKVARKIYRISIIQALIYFATVFSIIGVISLKKKKIISKPNYPV